MTVPRSRSGRYFEASAAISIDEQFQRMSPKVFWQVFLTSRAACIMVCMSSRLLRHNWACDETSPGSNLQCWVWLMCNDEGECDSTLWGGGGHINNHKHYTRVCNLKKISSDRRVGFRLNKYDTYLAQGFLFVTTEQRHQDMLQMWNLQSHWKLYAFIGQLGLSLTKLI